MKNIWIIFIGLLFISSCKKPFERSCLKTKGSSTTKEITISKPFDSLYLHGKIQYTLIPGKEGKIILKGGENLLPFIAISVENGRMEIKNNNKCKFLRSYKNEIQAIIYVQHLTYIQYRGSTYLRNKDTLKSNELRVIQKDGAGEIDLTVQTNYMSINMTNGFGNFYLQGNASTCYLSCSSNSYGDATSFIAKDKLIVNSNTAADMKINANTNQLDVRIQEKGNIKYIGSPKHQSIKKTGAGKLINIHPKN